LYLQDTFYAYKYICIISVIGTCKNKAVKNHKAKNGQKGTIVFIFSLKPNLSFQYNTIKIDIILHIIYVKNSVSILNVYQTISHNNIAILKSHHHIQAHQLTAIWTNKKLNIINIHILTFIAKLSWIFSQK